MFVVAWFACSPDETGDSSTTSPTTGTPQSTDTATDTDTTTGGTTGTLDDGILNVQVVNGYAWPTTNLQPGQTIHVWANVDPQREIVTGWVGDVDGLASPAEWNSSYVLPDHDVTLTASIDAAEWTPDIRTYNLGGRMRDAWVIEAADARGIAFFFHGGAYSLTQLRSNAGSTLVAHLVRAGWTVVGVESEAEAAAGTGGWSASLNVDTNTDLANVSHLREALLADGTAEEGEPWVAVGKSSGAIFANAVGAVGLAEAVVSYCAAGNADANTQTMAHTAWYLAAEDTTFSSAPTQAAGYQKKLDMRGLLTDLYVHPTTPLYDQRFERVTGVDATTAAEIANRLRTMGAVDDAGRWSNSGVAIVADLELPNGLTADQETAIGAEIEMMAADHELYDDVAARMTGFLDTVFPR